MARADQLDIRPDHHVVADGDTAKVHGGAAVVDEDVATESEVAVLEVVPSGTAR
jgi:hypothetical protein